MQVRGQHVPQLTYLQRGFTSRYHTVWVVGRCPPAGDIATGVQVIYLVNQRPLLGIAIHRAAICVAVNGNTVLVVVCRLPLYAFCKAGLELV